MKLNDTSSKSGIIQELETLLGMSDGDISGDDTLLKVFTRMINAEYRRVNTWIWEASGTWEYDDSNATDLPIATTDLVDEQQDYEIPSTAQKIDRVEVLDKSSNYQKLIPIDKSQIASATSEFMEEPNMPRYYDLLGRSIMLYPKPGASYVTTTKGLKLYFTRDISEFVSTDTTKEPGFVNNFHPLIPLGVAITYSLSYGMKDRVEGYKQKQAEFVKELKTFYGNQNRDQKIRIIPPKRNYK